MNFKIRINAAQKLAHYLLSEDEELNHAIQKSFVHNSWFTPENTKRAIQNIANEFLNEQKLTSWLLKYTISENVVPKIVAIVAAGNLPLVAFHDILCVLITGNKLQLKLSEKDRILLPFILKKWQLFDDYLEDKIELVEQLKNFDAVIATGNNTSARYFDFYFGKYKHIIRKNRNSIAILDGTETQEQLTALGHDVFDYFGLGCRNVSQIFVPKNYDFTNLVAAFQPFSLVEQHNAYMNNLDYQRTIYLMNQVKMVDINFINIVENPALCSPIACLHYQVYENAHEISNFIESEKEKIQCIVGKNYIDFGCSQKPSLSDFADNIDTIKFIVETTHNGAEK